VIIEGKCVVSIHYTLTNDGGQVIDSSSGGAPLMYLHDTQSLIPGLERELSGKAVGDRFDVSIQPEDGYGHVDPELVQQVDREVLAGVEDLQPGMQLEARDPDGHVRFVIVQEVTETGAVLNANPPLAGQVLHFDVVVDGIREATEEEMEHGHVHSAEGGHSH
jgi:FKBP-type peptidyl-prolyl cis-trans isomerase SlyD